ncbi:MAG TPA: hypothetical protein VL461_11650 [Dictyobacter sp.]|jgi:hypothetical protein|nr:hypothetical protein [Dictyobacter sp.]
MTDHPESEPSIDINFDLSEYQRDTEGLITNLEDARDIIRNLYQLALFLGNYSFEELPVTTYKDISSYLVGIYLLSHNKEQQDPKHSEGIEFLRSLLGDKFDFYVRLRKLPQLPAPADDNEQKDQSTHASWDKNEQHTHEELDPKSVLQAAIAWLEKQQDARE